MTRRTFSISALAAAVLPPPISDDERRARMENARRLMAENRIDAVVFEPGPSLMYFTGVRWGRSERVFAMVLAAQGDPAYIVPAFEEDRAREVIRFSKDIRIWQEDANPAAHIVSVLKDRGIRAGRIGLEESVRFFVFDGIRRAAPGAQIISADPVTTGCRMIKSPAELALLKRANEITLDAIRSTLTQLREGMTHAQIAANYEAAVRASGVRGGGLVTVGKYTAFPHGSIERQVLREGDFVLIDAGCDLNGYIADVTRTVIFGKPSDKQRRMWDLERKAQDAVLAAARPGVTCESLDAAARKVLTDAGLGPDYKLPGLPHRTGHGIGLEGHEAPHLVRGNKLKLQPGMCFSDEPTIVIPGEFGIRLEDCFYLTEDGAKTFTPQSPSIDHPFA